MHDKEAGGHTKGKPLCTDSYEPEASDLQPILTRLAAFYFTCACQLLAMHASHCDMMPLEPHTPIRFTPDMHCITYRFYECI